MAIMDFNYNQAINQANQVDAIAKEMLNLADRQFQATVDSIAVCWQGEASKQFIGYCTSTQINIRTQAKKLQDLAGRIRTVARIIEEAERRAKEQQLRMEAATKNSSGSST